MAEFVDWIETISVLELSQLVHEDRLGVTAAPAAVAVAAPAGIGDSDGEAAEQSEFEVVLSAAGGSKIQVIKELELLQD